MVYHMAGSLVDIPTSPLSAQNFANGEWRVGRGAVKTIYSPYTGKALGTLATSSTEDINETVASAKAAFLAWRSVPIKERCARLLAFRSLLMRDIELLAHSAAREAGKTVAEGRAEVLKGIEVLEFAAGLQNSDVGGAVEVSRGVQCEYRREPLGVTVGITPFNFPAMVPMWMIPISLAVGNAFILKPSDKVPFTPVLLAGLIHEAGFPAGIFSLVQGGREAVEQLAVHEDVAAVGFVGSSEIAKSVYGRATASGKRALCLGGAKNHLILTPDADPSVAVEGVVSSFTGCAGQRCMAASVLVAVGDVDSMIASIVQKAAAMQLGRDMGALIDAAAVSRLHGAIDKAVSEGASLLLDGRAASAPQGYEGGFWLGPTILDNAKPSMQCACVELFGPVLSIVRVATLDEALALDAASPYGNATSVFTSSGAVARYVAERSASGMIGINIGVPVPREPFSFGGTKASRFGAGDITGEGGVEFWSSRKKITTKWALQSDKNWMS
jgi:malonate-semialdehyde dehydrogenase (acetylating)/methylmalonate-semialdehyde dehydrogenase